ncbi:MAG TPA: DUF4112 domain-containing protein [Candidatus Sericytochromatia bacterium]
MSQLSPQPPRQPIETHVSSIRRLRRFSYLLDDVIRIPGTPFRFGIDPLLDVLPIGGDFLGTALSVYIVVEASRLGVPRATLVQMVSNILLDTVISTVPVLGTVVDATWKANSKNLKLLEEQLNIPQSGKRADWLFLTLLLGGLILAVIVMAAVSFILLRWLWEAVTG